MELRGGDDGEEVVLARFFSLEKERVNEVQALGAAQFEVTGDERVGAGGVALLRRTDDLFERGGVFVVSAKT